MRLVDELRLVRGLSVKAGVRPPGIVEAEIATDRSTSFGDGVVGVEIDLLIFH